MDRFINAWRMMFINPATGPLSDEEAGSAMPYMIWAGLAYAVLVWLVAVLLRQGLGRGGGAFVGAIVIAGMGWWLNGARGIKGLMVAGESWRTSEGTSEKAALVRSIVLLQTVILVKVFSIGYLIYSGRTLWLLLPTFVAAVVTVETLEDSVGVRKRGGAFGSRWAVAGLVGLGIGLIGRQLSVAILSVVLAWLLVPAMTRLLQVRAPEAGRHRLFILAETAELGVLMLLVIMLSH